jgi:putative phosphoesterase
MTLFGIISDTHGQVEATKNVRKLFDEQGVSLVIHCGDIGGEKIVRIFEGVETHFVYGNMDGENNSFRRAAEETDNTFHGWIGTLECCGKKICFMHGHQNERFETALRSGQWDLLCVGHTHVPMLQLFGKTLLLNPGALHRVAVPQVAVVRLPELDVRHFDVRRTGCGG